MEALLQIHSCFFSHCIKQCLLRSYAPQIFRKSSHFSLYPQKAVSPKIHWCSLKIKHFDPSNFFGPPPKIGLAMPLSHCITTSPIKDVWGQQSHVEKHINYRKSWLEVNHYRFVACYCYATKSNSRTMARIFHNVWVCRRRSRHEWTASSSLHHTRTVKLGSFSFAASFLRKYAWNCFHLFATIWAWLIIQQ